MKMLKKLMALCLVMIMMISAGCSSGSQPAKAENIAGTYNLYSMRPEGTEESDITTFLAEEQGITGVLELNADGTGKYTFMYQEYEITYDAENGKISADGSDDTFTYKDGVLEWKMDDKIHSFRKAEN